MNILRKIILFFLSLGFSGLLILTATAWTLRLTVLDRGVTASWLRDSQAYDNFVTELAKTVEKEQSKKNSQETGEANIDFSAVSRAAQAAFPPEALRENVEAVLNGVYDWLEGKTDKLSFTLDLNDEKQAFAVALGNEAVSRVATLPACPEQLPEEFDPFSAKCVPSGVNIQAEADRLKAEFASSQELLPETKVTADDIKVGEGNDQKSISESYPDAPKWYGYAKNGAYLLTATMVVNFGLILLFARPHRGGLKVAGWIFMSNGALLLLCGAVGKFASGDGFKPGIADSGLAEQVLLPFLKQASGSFARWSLTIGVAYVVAGITCFIANRVLRPKELPVDEMPLHPEETGKPPKKPDSQPAKKTPEVVEVKSPPEVPKKK